MTLHAFGTHQPLLFGACLSTSGPIIELGTGFYSTPFVHAVSAAQNRPLWSVDTQRGYLTFMGRYASELHRLALLDPEMMMGDDGRIAYGQGQSPAYFIDRQRRYFETHFADVSPSVVLVDHSPGFLRQPAIEWFADRAEFVVAHDTESREHYRYDFSRFRYCLNDVSQATGSSVMSNRRDCEPLRAFLWARGQGPAMLAPRSATLASQGQWASVVYPVEEVPADGTISIYFKDAPDGDFQVLARKRDDRGLGYLWRQVCKDGKPNLPVMDGKLLLETPLLFTVGNISLHQVDEVEFRYKSPSGEVSFEIS
jgi:hypothetical protein